MFDQAVAAIKLAKDAGFAVYTNSTFFSTDSPQAVIEVLTYLNDELKVRAHRGVVLPSMPHCGYEPSAVLATMSSLKESIRAAVSL